MQSFYQRGQIMALFPIAPQTAVQTQDPFIFLGKLGAFGNNWHVGRLEKISLKRTVSENLEIRFGMSGIEHSTAVKNVTL